jgi:tRNA uridine 5-carboxymethylaminomethyl modification enzyme
MNMGVIGQMSCNPAMGGIAKGQIVREIDALGGRSGIVSDASAIQFRMLNRSKGPAMWSPRTQNDRMRFAESWRLQLESIPALHFWQDSVTGVLVEGGRCVGVRTGLGMEIRSRTVVLTNGTFLNGIMHIGEKQLGGGRAGERAATGITEQLSDLGFTSDRMKTGTPPRIDGRSLDYSKMEEQRGDEHPARFSFTDTPRLTRQMSCHIAHTHVGVHDLLREGFDRSPMFTGRIQGLGPRYCPSIEDKIDRFSDKDSHQLFVEPEGWDTVEVYVNGFSTSLPEDVQFKALRAVPGFEHAAFFRPGYAVEYDFFHPTQLHHSLETRSVPGLYFAGQINGTTGYEEAAAQGLMAGVNAARSTWNLEPVVLRRSDAYIGVLIDDLVSKGTKEPYRMFTSRAEYRILLRQDNADERLTPLGHSIGLASSDRMRRLETKRLAASHLERALSATSVDPDATAAQFAALGSSPLSQKVKALSLVSRPELSLHDVLSLTPELEPFLNEEEEIRTSVEIRIKYAGYIEKEQQLAERLGKLQDIRIPRDYPFSNLTALSIEARQKLSAEQPETLAHASTISGVSPADVAVLLVHFGR